MPEPSVPSAPGSDRPATVVADGAAASRTPFSWPARVVLVAAAGLVVGGAAFTANEVAAALTPPAPAPAVAEEDAEADSERRTTALTGIGQPEGPEGPEGEQAAEHAGAAPAQGADGTAGAPGGGGVPGGGPAPGAPSEGDPGWADPRKEILEGILNTPQDRPPLEPLLTQEELDAMREAAEAEADPVKAEPDYSEFYE